jgi:2'-5' RNA ligase
MRLFTALWPPPQAIDALAAEVGEEVPGGWRRTDVGTWHVTLAFHGDADPAASARRLDDAARGLVVPRLRLAGAGAFDGVRWAGVEVDGSLADLVTAAGGDPDGFVAHVTVLRRRTRSLADPVTPWSGHVGPWWRPGEVLLVASEPGRGGVRYRVVHRVPFDEA